MTAKASKLAHADLITKILLIMTILNVAGNISNVVIWLMSPSWHDPSPKGEGIAKVEGLVIHVPNAKLGEHVKIKISRIGGTTAEAIR